MMVLYANPIPSIVRRWPDAGELSPTGFSLVEAMVALAVATALMLMAVPSYRWWIAEQQLMNHARVLALSMQVARSEAIKRGHRVNLCKSADGKHCADTGGWGQGFLMHEDPLLTGEVDGLDQVLRVEPPPQGISVAANRPLADYVSFTSMGQARMLSGALQMGTFTVCRKGIRAAEVVLVSSGRVRIDRTKTICP